MEWLLSEMWDAQENMTSYRFIARIILILYIKWWTNLLQAYQNISKGHIKNGMAFVEYFSRSKAVYYIINIIYNRKSIKLINIGIELSQ